MLLYYSSSTQGYLYFHKAPNAEEFHQDHAHVIHIVWLLYMYIYIYIYIERERDREREGERERESSNICVYIYIYMYRERDAYIYIYIYMYIHTHQENVRKIKDLHLYDCLRANKSMMAWGVEALDYPIVHIPCNLCCCMHMQNIAYSYTHTLFRSLTQLHSRHTTKARVPFLDRRFMDVAMSFDTKQKMCVDEKDE